MLHDECNTQYLHAAALYLNHCNSCGHNCGSLAKEEVKMKRIDDLPV